MVPISTLNHEKRSKKKGIFYTVCIDINFLVLLFICVITFVKQLEITEKSSTKLHINVQLLLKPLKHWCNFFYGRINIA